MTVSYAQQFEDVMLWRALKDVSNGAYIDIGANDPVVDSVSLLFYEKGWRGMHVEPMPEFAQRLREAREDEEVLEAAVGESDGEIELYSFGGTGLTTSIRQHAERHQKDGRAVELIKVPCLPLSKIFERFNRRHVHWLKIDVEGMEGAVLETWGESQIRPWIVVVESTLPNSQSPAYESWEHELTGRGYSFAYFDGLNRFYVHEDHQDRATAFSLPPNFFDYFSLSEHSPFSGHVAEKLHLAQNDLTVLEASLADLRHQRDHHAARLKEVTHSAESLEAALKQRDGHITRIEAELKQRNGQIESIETALKQRDGHIARIEAELKQRNGQIESIETALKQRDGHIARIGTELDAAKHAILATQNHVQHLEADRDRMLNLIAERDRELSQINSTLTAVQSMAATIQTALEVSYSENTKLEQALLVSRNDADQAHDWARQVRQSASWRISAPIRWAGGLARSGLKGARAILRPLLLVGLRIARKMPWLKPPVLAVANLSPQLRRKIDHFSQVRRPSLQDHSPIAQRKWNLTPDKKSVAAWEALLRTSKRHKGHSL
ncbi:MAG: hypothetical protein CME91_04075 [Hyphomonadaceae bacterium]|jgi:FkbM family methyltransferase|nr:hypothetical protein [Hyphomonadaceae bacterium]MBA28952.1 hypothetical protein [Hyphomonadaceae bacterium]|tara:strand:+ start:27859 stop:29514 length:1656 start_codon:yes stop_codon:yes gene_type:complete